MKRFFWFCAGADAVILEKCRTTEQYRHAGVGATVLLTAMLASLSGGYALYTSFGETKWAILFGIFWGIVIFNLDRIIVLSMRKESDTFFNRRELFVALPRFILALFIAIIVAKPLELKIFEKDLNRQLAEDQKAKLFALDAEFTSAATGLKAVLDTATFQQKRRLDEERASKPVGLDDIDLRLKQDNEALTTMEGQINALRVRRSSTQAEINSLDATKSQLEAEISVLNDSINASRSRPDRFNAFVNRRDALRTQLDRVQRNLSPKITERNNLNESIRELERERNALRASAGDLENQKESLLSEHYTTIRRRETEFNKFETMNETKKDSIDKKKNQDLVVSRKPFENYEGFYVRLEAMSHLEDTYTTIALASWFIMLLFIAVETAPVVVKLLMPRGSYERECDLFGYENYARSQRSVSAINDRVNHELRIAANKNKVRFDLRVALDERIAQKWAEAREEIEMLRLRKWKEREARRAEREFEQDSINAPNSSESENGRESFAHERVETDGFEAQEGFTENHNFSDGNFEPNGADQAVGSNNRLSDSFEQNPDSEVPHTDSSQNGNEIKTEAPAPGGTRNDRSSPRSDSNGESVTTENMIKNWFTEYEKIKNPSNETS